MPQTPSECVNTLAPFDSELETIASALDMAWRAWQYIERPDEVQTREAKIVYNRNRSCNP